MPSSGKPNSSLLLKKILYSPHLRNIGIKILSKIPPLFDVFAKLYIRLAMSGDCIFCKIIAGEVSSRKVLETDEIVAFEDINPQAPVHVLVVPKKHIPKITDVKEEDNELMGKMIQVCNEVARIKGIADDGFRIVINCNPAGGQTVYHLHFHVLGGRQMRWPPG